MAKLPPMLVSLLVVALAALAACSSEPTPQPASVATQAQESAAPAAATGLHLANLVHAVSGPESGLER